MNLSQGWSEWELSLIPESIIAGIGDRLDRDPVISAECFLDTIDREGIIVNRCPQCNRLHLKGLDSIAVYTLEATIPRI
jgi:hypothetical protein